MAETLGLFILGDDTGCGGACASPAGDRPRRGKNCFPQSYFCLSLPQRERFNSSLRSESNAHAPPSCLPKTAVVYVDD